MEERKYNVIHSAESDSWVEVYQVNDVGSEEINAAVYAALCVVARAVLDRSTCLIKGEHTAAELAGKIGGYVPVVDVLTYNEPHIRMAPEVCVKAGAFTCKFLTEDIFKMTANWEGVMGLTEKKACRFPCEARAQEPMKDLELRTYKRRPTYNPKRISLAEEEKRIASRVAQKIGVISGMAQDLSSEGMRKALSVLAAVEQFKDAPYYIYDLVPDVMRCKLWADFGKKGGTGPVPYCEKDFEYGPEVWKQVDEEYVKVLVEHSRKVLADYPAPDWLKEGRYVQFKNQENVTKKYQGKLYVDGIKAEYYGGLIEWFAVIKRERYKTERYHASRMEPWVEPEKPKKSKAQAKQKEVSQKSAPQKAKSESALLTVTPEPTTITDRLRAALRAQLEA